MDNIQVDWENIRPIDGSRRLGFEELCCQLARHEVPEDAEFRRKGTPDAGVECFAKLGNEEWGWQAKFFTSSPDSSQWGQIDKSVKTALDRHPDLVRYYVCLPLDPPDPRTPGRSHMMERWDERVEKWNDLAGEREIEFIYWGQSEILDRLSREEHRGRLWYWFNQECLSKEWFRQEIERAVDNVAGARYTPEIHVDIPVAKCFDALGRSDRYFQTLKRHHKEISNKLSPVRRSSDGNSETAQLMNYVVEATEQVLEAILQLAPSPVGQLPFDQVATLTEKASSSTDDAWEFVRDLEKRENDQGSGDSGSEDPIERPDILRSNLSVLQRSLDEFERECAGINADLANGRLMLLVGEAGTGKTHLFCDVARQRLNEGRPTILLMGQQFTSAENPWTQALSLLGLSGISPTEFIGALEAVAQVAGEKALVMVDALNEGRGRQLWQPHASAFVDRLLVSDWIAVALSVRSSYEHFVIPDVVDERAVRVEHHGFDSNEYKAIRTFFDHYKIEQPSAPLLAPEFQNPLFLKILCEGLSGSEEAISRLPRGLRGITAVFDLFLDAVNKRFSVDLGYPEQRNYVHESVRLIAEEMTERRQQWLPHEEAEQIVGEVMPVRSFDTSLYLRLVSEGILAEEAQYFPADEKHVEVTRFAYERFADHAIINGLLSKHEKDTSAGREGGGSLQTLFQPDGALRFVVDENVSISSGLISALCIQIPERFGVELFEVAPELTQKSGYPDSLLQSIIWRDHNAFSDSSLEALNQAIWNEYYFRRVLDTLIRVATVPGHSFNAEFLHRRLCKDEMPVRDAWWSTYLHHAYRSEGEVHRLVEWAWESDVVDHVDEKTARLCGTTLTWFLTSSNRFLRDRATKALVNLLEHRLDVFGELIDYFKDIDDFYVRERLYAVAYGCVMRSRDCEGIVVVAETVYEAVFQDGAPPAHILLRDYARGVVERALHLGCEIDVDEARIRPPYGSSWPEIPSADDAAIYEEKPIYSPGAKKQSNEPSRMQRWIVSSVMGWDFARYVIGMNTQSSDWLDIPITEPTWQSPEEKLSTFIESLPEESRRQWADFQRAEKAYKQMTWRPPELRFVEAEENGIVQQNEGSNEDNEQQLPDALKNFSLQAELVDNLRWEAWDRFSDTLTGDQEERANELRREVSEFKSISDTPYFDLSRLQRWILKRVFELGWTEDRFSHFDAMVRRLDRGRAAQKPERIGKKYQWIAYHEIVAMLADNYQYRESMGSEEPVRQYEGPWQNYIRDVDPSYLARSTEKIDDEPAWWVPGDYRSWDEEPETWVRETKDLPSVIDLLAPEQEANTRYARLSGFVDWSEPVPPEYDRFDTLRREIWYLPFGYLIQSTDVDELATWAKDQDFYGRWMPEPADMHDIFLGEHCWSPAAEYFQRAYFGGEQWKLNTTPVPVHVATVKHSRGVGTHDCSFEEGGPIRLPSCLLRKKLSLKWSGSEGEYVDDDGLVRALDPSVSEGSGPSACLVEMDALLEALNRENIAVFWAVIGEKRILPPSSQRNLARTMRMSGFYVLHDRRIAGFMKYGVEKQKQQQTKVESIEVVEDSLTL